MKTKASKVVEGLTEFFTTVINNVYSAIRALKKLESLFTDVNKNLDEIIKEKSPVIVSRIETTNEQLDNIDRSIQVLINGDKVLQHKLEEMVKILKDQRITGVS